MSGYDVATITVEHGPTAIGSAGPFTLVIDRPTAVGGGGRGFNGGQLLTSPSRAVSRTTSSERQPPKASPYAGSP